MKISFTSIGAVLLLSLLACNGSYDKAETAQADAGTDFKKQDYYEVADSTANHYQSPTGAVPAANPDWDKKIVRTATLNLEVKDYHAFYGTLRTSVRKLGGYIATENQLQSDYKLENTVTVKVPVAQFEEAMNLLSGTSASEKVIGLQVSSQDVTGEVVDTKSRMEAKRQVRLRYLELLKQAKNMDEILKVQQEINEIQEQIEMGTGRVSYLNHASALSTIQLTFFQVLNPAAPAPSDPTFFTRTWQAFEKGWGFIKNLIIAFITIWPLWLAVLCVWFIGKRFMPKGKAVS
jgi:hypothetical protein